MNFFKRNQKKNDVKSEPIAQDFLLTLCKGDSGMYESMGNFLLARPEEQVRLLGTTEQLIQRAETRTKSDPTMARIDLETAAKIEMYNGNMQKVGELLEKAEGLHDARAEKRELVLLSNLQQAMNIAREYYRLKVPVKVDNEPEEAPIVQKA